MSIEVSRMPCTSKPPCNPDWEKLLQSYLGFATAMAYRYTNIHRIEFEDIQQRAHMALFRAAMSYQAAKGINFATYARKVIQNELNTFYNKQRHYTLNETLSLDIPQNVDSEDHIENETPKDMLPDENADVYGPLLAKERRNLLHRAIKNLPYRARKVIEGILDGHDYIKIGHDLGFGRSSAKTIVCRSYYEALKLLKAELERNGLNTCEERVARF